MKKAFLAAFIALGFAGSVSAMEMQEQPSHKVRAWFRIDAPDWIVSEIYKVTLEVSDLTQKQCFLTSMFLTGYFKITPDYLEKNAMATRLLQELSNPNYNFIFHSKPKNEPTIQQYLDKDYNSLIERQIEYFEKALYNIKNFTFQSYQEHLSGKEQATEEMFEILKNDRIEELNKRLENIKFNQILFNQAIGN